MIEEIIIGIACLIYVALSLIRRWESRIPLIAAFFLLLVTGVAFVLGNQALADHLVFYAFSLLLAGLVLFLVDYVRLWRSDKSH